MSYLKEIKYSSLTNNSIIEFHFDDGTVYTGRVVTYSALASVFITLHHYSNYALFAKLGITNPNKFVKDIVGYSVCGGWPEVRSEEDLRKVLEALLKVNKANCSTSSKENVASKEEKSRKDSPIISIRKKRSIKLNFKL